MIKRIKQIDYDNIKESALRNRWTRYIFLLFTLARYSLNIYICRNIYRALSATLRYERLVSSLGANYAPIIIKEINRNIAHSIAVENKYLLKSFFDSKLAHSYREEFLAYGDDYAVRLKYPKIDDKGNVRQGDLLVLKPYVSDNEKGVLFVQYNDSFQKFAAIYDLHELSKYYRFVLEPSWWGYQDPIFFLFLGLNTDVIIEAQYEADYEFICQLMHNLHAVRMGAGDWVDPDIFKPNECINKTYDIVMVANWLKLKRHLLLFKAISKIKSRIGKIALIGYPRGGRTIEDIRREAIQYSVLDKLVFFENISPEEVNKVIQQSKIGIMLSKKEGANKGIYECLFSNIPVILTSQNIGVNRQQINMFTGAIATDADLSNRIIHLLDNIDNFSTRDWACANTGYMVSHVKLNSMLKNIAERSGEAWTVDIFLKKNATNAMYVEECDQWAANLEFDKLTQYLRKN